jgi:hypothetical protein
MTWKSNEKALFTTKLHFFALYQQNHSPQTKLQQNFFNGIKDLDAILKAKTLQNRFKLST